jgi:type I restriction enzyme S subunit
MNNEREFKDLPEEWEVKKIKEFVLEIIDNRGKTPPTSEEGIALIETVCITDKNKKHPDFSKVRNYVSENTYNKWFRSGHPKENDILIAMVGENAGSVAVMNNSKGCIAQNLIALRLDENTYPEFSYYLLTSEYFQRQMFIVLMTAAQPSLKLPHLLNFIFPLPPLPEQQKIAEILETVDNAIEKTDKIIEKYKRIKQGLLQDLLTKGIDENGNIRDEKTHKFKDSPLGKIPEEWEVVRLGEVFKLKSGKTKPIDTSEFGNYPVYGGNGILGYTNEKNFNKETIIIGRVGEYCGSVYLANEGWVTDNALYVVAKKIDYNNIFLCYLLKYLNLNQFSSETGQPLMTQTIIYSLLIPLPPLPEQQRIAEILSQIDQTIEKEQQYKEKLQKIKQGLMQDLLTGKFRVNHLVEEEEK